MYYSVIHGNNPEKTCPIEGKFGLKWRDTHQVDWSKLSQVVSRRISQEIHAKKLINAPTVVDIVKTHAFTSLNKGKVGQELRRRMVKGFEENNFLVHRYDTISITLLFPQYFF